MSFKVDVGITINQRRIQLNISVGALCKKIVKGFQLLTIFAKSFILDIWQEYESASEHYHPKQIYGLAPSEAAVQRCSLKKRSGENSWWIVISIKLQIALRHGCCPVNLLHKFASLKNTSGWLLLHLASFDYQLMMTVLAYLKSGKTSIPLLGIIKHRGPPTKMHEIDSRVRYFFWYPQLS